LTEPVTFKLHTEAATLPVGASLKVQAETGDQSWTIEHLGDTSSGGQKADVGQIRREGRELSFAWSAPPADMEIRRQLANCLLEMTCGNEFRNLQLREPLVASSITIDLSREKPAPVEFDVPDSPSSSKLFFRVVQLVDFARGAKLQGTGDVFAFTSKPQIKFMEMEGPEIELGLLRLGSGRLRVNLYPKYTETANREFVLTLPSLQKLYAAQKKIAQEATTYLSNAQPNLATAQKNFQQLQSNKPTDAQGLAVWQQKVLVASRTVDNLSLGVRAANEKLAEANSRLSAVPEVRAFIESLNGKARIQFQFIARAGSQDLILVDGTNP
jgi:hypothetical protein